MKSHLSHILPVHEACRILGEPCVRRLVRSFLAVRHKHGVVDPQEEIALLKALQWEPPEDGDVPPHIRQTWNRYTKRTAGLDKAAFLKWTVPPSAFPRQGPGGHLGLFDCWVYALSGSASHSSTLTLTPVVLLPDVLVALAICHEYRTNANAETSPSSGSSSGEEEEEDDSHSNDDQTLTMISVLAFRIYDSYQKKGVLVRDTLHRFLSDIYGEDSYRAPKFSTVLDRMFALPRSDTEVERVGPTASTTRTTLSGTQFIRAVGMTSSGTTRHVLLDWIAVLETSCLQAARQELPPSTCAYLDTISESQPSLERLCHQYGLTLEASLYDMKRKFHSLVESSHAVIQGDIMSDQQESEEGGGSAQTTARPLPKRQVVSQQAFCKAVCAENEELGHGGYLPESLAVLTFQGVCERVVETTMVVGEQPPPQDGVVDESTTSSSNPPSAYTWSLYNVLTFGCHAVRVPIKGSSSPNSDDEDTPLLRVAFRVFCLLPGGSGSKVLTRKQVGHLLLTLLEHAAFRLRADSSKLESEQGLPGDGFQLSANLEETRVDAAPASLLGILPLSWEAAHISLGQLVDHALDNKEHWTFADFCQWHHQRTDADLPQRLGPYLMDLRLIASVLFGVPPTRASLEYALAAELKRRHKYRYHQTDVARRGPRGTVWYIVEDRWYRSWLTCVRSVSGTKKDVQDGRTVPHSPPRGLGKIQNTILLDDNGTLALKPDLRYRQDYEIVPPLVWSALQAWYDGGPPIQRTVVPYIPTTGAPSPHSRVPRVRTECEIELYPFFVTVFMCDASSRGEARPFQQYVPVSRVSAVRVLLLQLCKGLEIDPKFGRLWMMESQVEEGQEDWMLNLDSNIVEQRQRRGLSVDHGDGDSIVLLLELKDEGSGQWPRGSDGKTWAFKEKGQEGSTLLDSDYGDGIVGLYNMGNTCYLNSSIQCLSHTPIFRDYFTSKVYLNDINTTNPLGHGGKLAQVSAVLINSLWKNFNQNTPHQPKRVTAPGSYAPVSCHALTPKTFKDSLGKFNDHFAGNEQHDAQELLAFLLGGLSEDLNRIVDKPYIEAPDSDGRPDAELADIWWSNHLKREMSIIVALFTGQYKSLLTCRTCTYESARFEPFSFVQLPLPEDDHIKVSLILYPLQDGLEPTKYSVRVQHDGKLLDVLISLAKVMCEDEATDQESDEDDSGSNVKSENGRSDEEANAALQQKYQKMAKNLAVVDMQEGYIFKIAPNSWSLQGLQNKDSGELPLLHVYELDPLPLDTMVMASTDPAAKTGNGAQDGAALHESDKEKNDETTSAEDSSSESSVEVSDEFANIKRVESESKMGDNEIEGSDLKFSFLAFAQRRSELVSRDMLHPFSHQVFGTPLLLRVVDLEGFSGRDLYDLVAKRMRNFVPKSALRFLAENNKVSLNESLSDEGGDEDSRIRPRAGTRQRRRKTGSEMEEVSAGPVPRYGFRLRIASRDGRRCALCPWFECCIGCLVPDDDYPTMVVCGDSLVLDWHFAVDIATAGFGLRANQPDTPVVPANFRARPLPVPFKNHRSCGDQAKKKGYAGAITLEDCLDAFAKEERIPEAYCSSCKDFRVQTKRMSLWRLPPVVIIHLKRFQFTQHMRRKLRDLVVFPVEGLDLSRIVASGVLHVGEDVDESGKKPSEKKSSKRKSSTQKKDTKRNGDPPPTTPSRETSESTDGETADEEADCPLSPTNHTGRSEMLYDLYGVVHHQGALSGGHYVASLKSEIDGQWRLFNDAQVFEIHSRDVVDASAYILFYIRRDVKEANLQDFWDIVAREGEGLTEEDMEAMMKGRSDRCAIS